MQAQGLHGLKHMFETQPEADINVVRELRDGTQLPKMNETFGFHAKADNVTLYELNSD